jgi:hypothetical protein
MRLSQACVPISDFASHHRLRSPNAFREDVEEFFHKSKLQYKPDVSFNGPYGHKIKLDFEVPGTSHASYILILAAKHEAAAHSSANEIFGKWHDLKKVSTNGHHYVTIFNSASQAVREDDMKTLQSYSEGVSYPKQGERLVSVLQ